jgi:hypothetical protein
MIGRPFTRCGSHWFTVHIEELAVEPRKGEERATCNEERGIRIIGTVRVNSNQRAAVSKKIILLARIW